jgi:hypothetical protein
MLWVLKKKPIQIPQGGFVALQNQATLRRSELGLGVGRKVQQDLFGQAQRFFVPAFSLSLIGKPLKF